MGFEKRDLGDWEGGQVGGWDMAGNGERWACMGQGRDRVRGTGFGWDSYGAKNWLHNCEETPYQGRTLGHRAW